MTSFLRSDRSSAVAVWLLVVAALVFAMVVVGGATRLTGSGLSITEWRPITGVIPPMSDAAWQAEFAKYRQIPQYELVNRGMSLAQFQTLYWWEWAHRLLGRIIGVAFAVPFAFFLVSREIPKRLIWRCVLLLGLGALQGLIGWWMVSSGLADRVSVAPERLAVHLGLALLVFVLLIWTGLDAWTGAPRQEMPSRLRTRSLVFLGALFVQALLGALVAGTGAGMIYTDWPLMNGAFFPREYFGDGLWDTIAHNQASVQFHHRIGGYLVFAGAVALAWAAVSDRPLAPLARALAVAVAVAVTLQALIGVATVMLAVPLWLGVLHQAGAAIVLAVATAFAWRVRRL